MAFSDTSSATNHFAQAYEEFVTTASGNVSSGAATVGLTSVSGLTNGDIFVGIIEPGETTEQTFTGVVDTSGSQITGVVWTRGTNAAHAVGSTIVDYVTGTHHNLMKQGILVHTNQDGTLKNNAVTTASITDGAVTAPKLASGILSGWNDMSGTTTYDGNTGGKVYTVDVDEDVTGTVSEGMKFRTTRNTTAPTTSYDLEEDDSQYLDIADGSQTGLDFVGDFTIEAWIKPENFTSTVAIVAKWESTGNQRSWMAAVNPNGTLYAQISSDGTSISAFTTDRSIHHYVGKWMHVAVSVDVSATTAVWYVNGEVWANTASGSETSVYDSTQAVEVGAMSTGTNFLDGRIADVRVWDDIRTADEIRDNMAIQLVGNETNLQAYWKLADLTDETSNGNDLSANGSPSPSTVTDHPFNDIEYGVITGVSESGGVTTLTLNTGDGYNIPNDTLDSTQFSIAESPHNFPEDDVQLNSATYPQQGVWQSWSPTWTNLTVGDGTESGSYVQIGKTVFFRYDILFGSTSSIDGANPSATLPVTASSNWRANTTGGTVLGTAIFQDTGTEQYFGGVQLKDIAEFILAAYDTGGTPTKLRNSSVSAASPFTWTNGDRIAISGVYEAA